jgi:signal transduction histidine kinase
LTPGIAPLLPISPELTSVTNVAVTNGHPALLERLLSNLINNAITHNIAHGYVRVETGTTVDHRARVLVSNSGPQIPASEIDRLFEPFQRHIPARTNGHDGYGLGLSIVAAIASAHRASLTAQPRRGGGLDIEVTFTAATPGPQNLQGVRRKPSIRMPS